MHTLRLAGLAALMLATTPALGQSVSFVSFSREELELEYRREIKVDGLGYAVLTTRRGPEPAIVNRGQATPAQLSALDTALEQARFMELPDGPPGGRGGGYVYRLTPPGAATPKRYSAGAGHGDYAERMQAVDDAIRSIIEQVQEPRAVSFDTFSREELVTEYRQMFTIDALGWVRLVTTDPNSRISQRGRATREQLQALDRALERARFQELPDGSTSGPGGGYIYRLAPPGRPAVKPSGTPAVKLYSAWAGHREYAERMKAVDDAIGSIIAAVRADDPPALGGMTGAVSR